MKLDKNKIINEVVSSSIIIVIAAVVILCFNMIAVPYFEKNKAKEKDYLTRIDEVIEKVSKEYVDEVSIDKLVDGAITGIAAATGDPYTRYMDDEEYSEMLTSGTEKYGGLGIHITYDEINKGIVILSIMPNSSAMEEGLEIGDVILKVGDKNVSVETYYECVDAIKGEEGTKVKLTIQRNGKIFEQEYTRKIVSVNNIETKKIEGNIGYIRILSFENNIALQFKEAYDKLLQENISGLVIDLRNNPGGLVSETVKIANMLLPEGEIVKLVYKDGKEKVYKADGKNEIKIPLTVLVNEKSASASEILAGAIKDSGKGTVIGNKTYGKGIVQTVEKLEGAGAVSITTSKYYTTSGIEIHKNGIEPNIKVDLSEDYKNKLYVPSEQDLQLKKAIEILKQK